MYGNMGGRALTVLFFLLHILHLKVHGMNAATRS